MRHGWLLVGTCVVVSQTAVRGGFKTECKGAEENGQVVLDTKIAIGQAADYTPFVVDGDDVIHGKLVSVHDAEPAPAKLEVSSDTGKRPS